MSILNPILDEIHNLGFYLLITTSSEVVDDLILGTVLEKTVLQIKAIRIKDNKMFLFNIRQHTVQEVEETVLKSLRKWSLR
jgi:hypothetical protein